MKVHPAPKNRNITLRYDIAAALASAAALSCRQKKLRRLPHIFTKVLELPFRSDADVSVEETADSLRFIVATDDVGNDIRAQAVEIYPGVTKIVVKTNGVIDEELLLGELELELDVWRFRLPECTLPELATADYVDGELVVTVPKGVDDVDEEEGGDIGAGQLLLVQ